MPAYRSYTTTQGRNMAGARALWRATGTKDGDFDKPIIAIANSFTQFVPGHVHLKDLGQLVAREIEQAGGVAKEFNTIAVDDGIAMGHDGMLYSLPSRDLIADSVEYMVNAHCADALVCISNCDKITPGMLMAAMRINIPVIFVSGGPMEAGKVRLAETADIKKLDLIDAMVMAADSNVSDADLAAVERSACPTCGSCSGMFTANSMNCLTEALGLSLPGNGTVVATHADREQLFKQAEMVWWVMPPRSESAQPLASSRWRRLLAWLDEGRLGSMLRLQPASTSTRPVATSNATISRYRSIWRLISSAAAIPPSVKMAACGNVCFDPRTRRRRPVERAYCTRATISASEVGWNRPSSARTVNS